MTYSQLAKGFQELFPGGRFKTWKYLGGNLVKFIELEYNDWKADVVVNLWTDDMTFTNCYFSQSM